MTQRDRVLKSLQAAGPRGISQADWLGSTPDGGPSITRVAARVNDLKRDGYVIDVRGKRDKCAVYVLVREPHEPLPVPEAEVVRLFAPPPANALLGDAA